MKTFLTWLIQKNKLGIVYYSMFLFFIGVVIYEKKEIVQHNNIQVFYGMLVFLLTCLVLFHFVSVIPEYKKRND
jgi:hypothetical protein